MNASTIGQALHQARGLDRLDAQLLLLHVLARPVHDRAWLLAHDRDALPPAAQAAYIACVQRRAGGEPLAYISGHKEFYGLDLQVDARVLVPRPETETLVEWALAVLPPNDAATTVLDLGTGSGAIALALKHNRPVWQISAVDASEEALGVAQANALRLALSVEFSHGAWFAGVPDPHCRFGAIVSNPPYVAAQNPHLEQLTHEPLQALVSGADGLDDIRHIIRHAAPRLRPGGWLLLEHGYDQAHVVRTLLQESGFLAVQSRLDLGGIERCSGGQCGCA